MFLVGDLNLRVERYTGDSTTNLRSRLRHAIEEMGLCWPQQDVNKWTVDTARGISTADYVFASSQAQRLVKSTKVWKAERVTGSDHRVVSCDMERGNHLDEPILSLPNSFDRNSQCVWKIRSSDLDNPGT